MKKFFTLLLGILLWLPALAQDFVYEYEGQTLTYTVIDEEAKTCMTKEGDCDISSGFYSPGNKISGSLIIPSVAIDNGTEYTVTSISDCAFVDCIGLTSVVIPSSVASIGKEAFGYCIGLTSVVIPNSVTSIGHSAFNSCDGLTSVEIPNSVTSIGVSAFYGCDGLTSVVIPNSVTAISDYTFMGCSGLTSVVIPNSVTSIGMSAFRDCSGLTSVVIGNSVTSIDSDAFWNCSGLTSLVIPNSVTSIGPYAFMACSSLTSVVIPNSVTSIYTGVFAYCSGMTSVVIPSSVTSIGSYAFRNCDSLNSVYYSAEEPLMFESSDIFSNYETSTLYVPAVAVEKCKQVTPWCLFGNIVAYDFPSGINEIVVDLDATLPYEIYNINGAHAGSDLEDLPAGVYIVRQGNVVKKIAVK